MTALLRVPIYAGSPRNVEAVLSSTTVSRSIPLVVNTTDFGVGYNNVTEMKLWGDLDPAFHPELHGNDEADSQWMRFRSLNTIVLSAGDGVKTLYVKVRNSSHAESDVIEVTSNLTALTPHPSILWADDGLAPSVVDGRLQFAWSASHAFTAASLCMTNQADASYADCDVELVAYGPGAAGDERIVDLSVADDILTVDPYPSQTGHKMFKVFIQVGGEWYGATNGR